MLFGAFFYNSTIGIVYFASYFLFMSFLTYLSIVDIKKHEIEYWQTGTLFGLSVTTTIISMLATNRMLNSVTSQHFSAIHYLIVHGTAAVIIFLFMLIMALIKKNGHFAFGGADIWALTAVSFYIGIFYLKYLLLIICLSYLLFVSALKITNKKNINGVAFLPFITVGTFATSLLFLV